MASSGINIDVTDFSPNFFMVSKEFLEPLDELLEPFIPQTNLYATLFLVQHPASCHRKIWMPANLKEVKTALGILPNMGLF